MKSEVWYGQGCRACHTWRLLLHQHHDLLTELHAGLLHDKYPSLSAWCHPAVIGTVTGLNIQQHSHGSVRRIENAGHRPCSDAVMRDAYILSQTYASLQPFVVCADSACRSSFHQLIKSVIATHLGRQLSSQQTITGEQTYTKH